MLAHIRHSKWLLLGRRILICKIIESLLRLLIWLVILNNRNSLRLIKIILLLIFLMLLDWNRDFKWMRLNLVLHGFIVFERVFYFFVKRCCKGRWLYWFDNWLLLFLLSLSPNYLSNWLLRFLLNNFSYNFCFSRSLLFGGWRRWLNRV